MVCSLAWKSREMLADGYLKYKRGKMYFQLLVVSFTGEMMKEMVQLFGLKFRKQFLKQWLRVNQMGVDSSDEKNNRD